MASREGKSCTYTQYLLRRLGMPYVVRTIHVREEYGTSTPLYSYGAKYSYVHRSIKHACTAVHLRAW